MTPQTSATGGSSRALVGARIVGVQILIREITTTTCLESTEATTESATKSASESSWSTAETTAETAARKSSVTVLIARKKNRLFIGVT